MDGCQVGGVLDVADPARNLLTLQMIVLITRLTLVGGYSRTPASRSSAGTHVPPRSTRGRRGQTRREPRRRWASARRYHSAPADGGGLRRADCHELSKLTAHLLPLLDSRTSSTKVRVAASAGGS
jgi:hypothetical protein